MTKDIVGYEGLYRVHDSGEVESLRSNKFLKASRSTFGYLYVNLSFKGNVKHCYVHRLVAEAFIPNPSNKPQVNHIDGDKLNNHASNLEWVTYSENNRHAYSTGLKGTGEKNKLSILTNAQVLLARENPGGLTDAQLAKLFNVTQGTICSAVTGRTYKNVGGKIRQAKPKAASVPMKARSEIRCLFKSGDIEYGRKALAKKYNVTVETISRILHEDKEMNSEYETCDVDESDSSSPP